MFPAIARCGQPEPNLVRFTGALAESKRKSANASAIPPQPQVRAVRPTAARARPERSQAEQSHKKAVPRRLSPQGTTRPGIAKRSINALSLLSSVSLVHTARMQISALFSSSFSQAALQSKASCSSGKGPASNPSIKRTVKGLRPSPAAYVKR